MSNSSQKIASKGDMISFNYEENEIFGRVEKVLENSVIVSYDIGGCFEQTVVNHKKYSIWNN